MATVQAPPAAGYKFNNIHEIKSHSAVLYNERMAILFYLLDMKSIELNTSFNIQVLMEVRALIKQIYKNIRTLIRNNPTMRVTMKLETKEEGVYITDLALGIIDNMIEYCETNGYTQKRIYIITDELNKVETLMKDVLQYFHYFIRPEFNQKPDVDLATEKYKEIADKNTIEELKQLVGSRCKIDFDGLGSKRIDLSNVSDEDEEDDDEKYEEEEDESSGN